MMSSSQIPHHSSGINHSSVPKQRLKSATMNKRMQRGFRDNDDGGQYDEYQGYTGHLSNSGMPAVGGNQYGASGQQLPGTRQSKTSSGARAQTWKN